MECSIGKTFSDDEYKAEILADADGYCLNVDYYQEFEITENKKYYIEVITSYKSSIDFLGDISLKLPSKDIGFICLGSKEKEYTTENLTLFRKACIMIESSIRGDEFLFSSNNFQPPSHNSFVQEKSFVFIEQAYYESYKKNLRPSSGIWGGYSHSPLPNKNKHYIDEIYVKDNLFLPTLVHEKKLSEAISAKNSFDRYLKKYQLLELLYDYWCVARLRNVGEDLSGFRDIMNNYTKTEIDTLQLLITSYVTNIDEIALKLQKVSTHNDLSYLIFIKFARESAPIKEKDKWDTFIKAITSFSPLSSKDIEFDKSLSWKKSLHQQHVFDKEILKISGYFIYRIRCSIAHSKIGEFIFDDSHDEFIINFAEPLIDEIISQILSNPDLNKLLRDSKRYSELANS